MVVSPSMEKFHITTLHPPTITHLQTVSGPLKAAMRLGQEVMSGDNDYPSSLFKVC